MAYIAMMAPRLIEMRRVLKQDGSIFLHCDPTASHYIKLVMDGIFGAKLFLNEIAWCYDTGGRAKRHFPRKHDVLFWYRKSSKYNFYYDAVSLPRDFSTMHESIQVDDEGRAYQQNIKGGIAYRYYGDKGVLPNDWWTDIQALNPASKERLGYPTQKPVALLERIINACSKENDCVLDPFCGCGTAVHAAEKLKRRWLGIDITHLAIGLIEYRLKDAFGINPRVIGAPEDMAGAQDLWQRDPFQFEAWAVTRLLGIKPNERKVGDRGIDGVGRFYLGRDAEGREKYGRVYVSVKGGQNLGVAMIRDFRGAMEREKADLGIFICQRRPPRGMETEAAAAGRYREIEGHDLPRLQIYTIEDFFEGRRPDLPPTIDEGRRRAQEEGGYQPGLI
jgi:DNA modification methylase